MPVQPVLKVNAPNIGKIVAEQWSNPLFNIMGETALDEIDRTADTTGGWPVDTGLSRDSFDYNLEPDARSSVVGIHITNDTDYAEQVEERTGAATRTIERALPEMVKAADKFLQRKLNV